MGNWYRVCSFRDDKRLLDVAYFTWDEESALKRALKDFPEHRGLKMTIEIVDADSSYMHGARLAGCAYSF